MKDPIRVTTLTRIWKDFRRKLSRNEWAVRLWGLSRCVSKPTEPGLILVQIDGLSKKQMEQAVANGSMPFLKSLVEKEHYENRSFYSGLPSSTPSVQGELYYGIPTIVPAFGFRDHRTGRLVRMFASDIAQDVESRLSKSNPGLLKGGSSYCNNYGGGAADVHFCATSFGWSEFLSSLNPIKLLTVLILNFWMFFRVLGLMIVEFVLATIGFFKGIFSGRRFWQELLMIPARVVVVVLLRELVTVGAGCDSARGLPVIHLNLLGYDEQAHRRGPESRFAHWTLRGIDNAIRRIWKSAHRGAGREYDIWVFSDHGQETTVPYQIAQGKLIQQVVAEAVDGYGASAKPENEKVIERLPTRADWLGIGWLVSMLFGEQDYDLQSRSPHVQTVTSGPLAFVYLLNEDIKKRRAEICAQLVDQAKVPMAVMPTEPGQAKVVSGAGTFSLPQDALQVFGPDHPFLPDIAQDLIKLAHHPDAGEIILVGWTQQDESTSFVLQNGAHAGPGINETRGFALLPPDVPVPDSNKEYLRPSDLRLTAIRFLGRDPDLQNQRRYRFPSGRRVRLLTYNVHACVGMDGQLSPERIARVIAQTGANIVCLQELDVFRHRSGKRDQAHAIARYLEMNFEFHPAWHLEEEKFGNAILTQFPMRIIEAKGLHHHKADRSRRSGLWAEIDINDQTSIQVINTHMSIYPQEQLIQAQQLMEEWVEPARLLGPVVLCGDFNTRPNSAAHKVFAKTMFDVESFDTNRPRSTYFSPFPLRRLDHIFVTEELSVQNTQVIETRLAKVSSDHLPLSIDLALKNYDRSLEKDDDQFRTRQVPG
jgi:endonuclease/exonuclease/phosphatase family metal-dependent hydrolase